METITVQISLPNQRGTLELQLVGNLQIRESNSHSVIFQGAGQILLIVDDLKLRAQDKALITSVSAKEAAS